MSILLKQIIQEEEEDGVYLITGLSKDEQKVLKNWITNPDENEYTSHIGWGQWTLSNNETVFMLECINIRAGREAIIEFATEELGCEHIFQDNDEE